MTSERRKANACLTLNLILPEQEPCLLARSSAGSVQLLISLGSLQVSKGALDGYKYCMRLLEGQPALEGYLTPLMDRSKPNHLFKYCLWAQISTAKFYKQARKNP